MLSRCCTDVCLSMCACRIVVALCAAPVLFRSNSRVNLATQAMMTYYRCVLTDVTTLTLFSVGSFVFAPKRNGRTLAIQNIKAQTSQQDYDHKGYEDNRFNYMARGYS
jgi:hypothetical protein